MLGVDVDLVEADLARLLGELANEVLHNLWGGETGGVSNGEEK